MGGPYLPLFPQTLSLCPLLPQYFPLCTIPSPGVSQASPGEGIVQRGNYWGSRGHNECLGEKGKVRSTHRDIYLLFNNTWGEGYYE